MTLFALVISAAIVIVLAAAVFGKIYSVTAFLSFKESLAQFGIHRSQAQAVTAVGVVACEIGAGVSVTIAPMSRLRLVPAIILLSLFTVALGVAQRRGRIRKCNCFGTSIGSNVTAHIYANATLIAFAAIATAQPLNGLSAGGETIFGLGMSAVIAAIVVFIDQLRDILVVPPRQKVD